VTGACPDNLNAITGAHPDILNAIYPCMWCAKPKCHDGARSDKPKCHDEGMPG